MIFKETKLEGAYLIELEKHGDERGYFGRTFCKREFEEIGLNTDWVQCNTSFNQLKGTLRGMHYQEAPFEEIKLVRCTRGSIFDVIIDLRPKSPTFSRYAANTLTVEDGNMHYIPKGFAHGFITLEDETEVFYQMSEYYSPEHGRGVRWNDPAFGIQWPVEVSMISDKDQSFLDFIP